MGDKSLQKKNYIIKTARNVFLKMGYKSVTMKDIVEACGISRGGLYLYFSSVKEIFEAVYSQENKSARAVIEESSRTASNPGEAMLMYLEEQKKEILKKDNITAALYEYLFENKTSDNSSTLKSKFNDNVKALEKLICDGVKQEWMVCDMPGEAAKNILYTLEGLKITAYTAGVTAAALDNEIEYIMGTLGMALK